MRILLTGGGTGGHILPLCAVAKEIKKIQQAKDPLEPIEFLFIGALDDLSKEIFDVNNIRSSRVMVGKLRRYFSLRNFIDVFLLVVGIIQSLWKVWLFMPDVIFSKGGYGSVPVALVGWLYRIPIVIHDSDAIPGLANRFLSVFSKRVAISFKEAARFFKDYKVAITGNPIREDLILGSKEKAREIFKLGFVKPLLLIIGGSQGSRKINNVILEILPQLLEYVEIIHQTGQNNYEEVKNRANSLNTNFLSRYYITPFLKEDLKDALVAADLILSRAGSTINEISAVGKPSILIPLENAASDHQRENAYIFARAGASLVIEESNLTPHLLLSRITELLNNKELLKTMGEHSKKLAHPEAARLIAQEVVRLGSE